MAKVYLNIEFVYGFVEALFCEFEKSLGYFKSDLESYSINCKPHKDNSNEWIVSIPFAIITDHRDDIMTYFYLCEQDTVESLRSKVETSVEEIIRTIKRFKDEN